MSNIQNAKTYINWINETVKLDAIADIAKNRKVFRGQVYWCYFGINIGSEESNKRPCLIIRNNHGNLTSPNTIVAPITRSSSKLPIVVPIADQYDKTKNKILEGSVLLGNIITISKARLGDYICELPKYEMDLVDAAIAEAVDLARIHRKYENLLAQRDKHIDNLKNTIERLKREIKSGESTKLRVYC